MDNNIIIKLIESQSAELAALRQLIEEKFKLLEEKLKLLEDGFRTLNWKLDRVVEIVDNLNNKELIANKRLSALETDVAGLKTDMAGVKADMGGVKADMGGVKADIAAIKAKLSL